MMHMANYWDNIDEGKEIGMEIGKEIGKEIGIEIGKEIGIELGRIEGIELGRTEGRNEGRTQGRTQGRAQMLIEQVEKCMNKHNFSLEETLDMLGETMEDYLKAKEIVDREELFV